jgi:hypothetical protein
MSSTVRAKYRHSDALSLDDTREPDDTEVVCGAIVAAGVVDVSWPLSPGIVLPDDVDPGCDVVSGAVVGSVVVPGADVVEPPAAALLAKPETQVRMLTQPLWRGGNFATHRCGSGPCQKQHRRS